MTRYIQRDEPKFQLGQEEADWKQLDLGVSIKEAVKFELIQRALLWEKRGRTRAEDPTGISEKANDKEDPPKDMPRKHLDFNRGASKGWRHGREDSI